MKSEEKLQNIIDRIVILERYGKRLNNDLHNYHVLTEDDKASLSFEYERFIKNLIWIRMELAEYKHGEKDTIN